MEKISKKRQGQLILIATETLDFWEDNKLTLEETMFVARALYCCVLHQSFTSRGYDLSKDITRNFALSMERAAICDGLDKMSEYEDELI